jgi:hypothetical protein
MNFKAFSRPPKVLEDQTYFPRGETAVSGLKTAFGELLHQLGTVAYPALQSHAGGMHLAVGEVELRQLMLLIKSDFRRFRFF